MTSVIVFSDMILIGKINYCSTTELFVVLVVSSG